MASLVEVQTASLFLLDADLPPCTVGIFSPAFDLRQVTPRWSDQQQDHYTEAAGAYPASLRRTPEFQLEAEDAIYCAHQVQSAASETGTSSESHALLYF